MSDVKDWALLEDNRKFMYESKPCDNFDNEILPSLDSSDTTSSASILKDESANKVGEFSFYFEIFIQPRLLFISNI